MWKPGRQRRERLQAVHLDGTHLHWALVRHRERIPRLEACASLPGPQESPDAALAAVVERHQARAVPVVAVLSPGQYQLLLMEAPAVPPDELRDAMRWQVREFIDYPVEEAVIDVFDAPPVPSRPRPQVYAVVTRRERTERLARFIEGAGLVLEAIDIPELALRNLASRLEEARDGLTLACLLEKTALIALLRGDTLHLARTIEIEPHPRDGETDPDALAENLALEIQRTLDYHDRHFREGRFPHLRLAWQRPSLGGLAPALEARLGMPAAELAPCRILACEPSLEPSTLPPALLAIAGALRREPLTP